VLLAAELRGLPDELALQVADEGLVVQVQPVHVAGREQPPQLGPGGAARRIEVGRQVGGVHLPGPAVVGDIQGGHGVQPQEREVRQVLPAQPRLAEMGVDAPEAAETAQIGADPPEVGQLDPAAVPHHHVLDGALPVHQHPHLAPDLGRDPGQARRELRRQQALGRQAALVDFLKLADLAGLESRGVAVDLGDGSPPPGTRPGPSAAPLQVALEQRAHAGTPGSGGVRRGFTLGERFMQLPVLHRDPALGA